MDLSEYRYWPDPPGPPQKARVTFAEVGCVAAMLAIVAAVLFPVFAPTCGGSHRNSCLSFTKQSALATIMYAQDYDDRLPRAKWMDTTYPYVKNWDVFTCTEIRTEDKSAFGKGYDRSMLGRHVPDIHLPESQPLQYDSSMLYKNVVARIGIGLASPGRHGKSNTVAFLDGHCKIIGDKDAALRWPRR